MLGGFLNEETLPIFNNPSNSFLDSLECDLNVGFIFLGRSRFTSTGFHCFDFRRSNNFDPAVAIIAACFSSSLG